MPTDKQLDDRISRWLEAEAPVQLPDRVLRATFDHTRQTRQQRAWRRLLGRIYVSQFVSALSGAAVVVVAAALALGLYANRPGVGGPGMTDRPASPFAGNWEATDHPPDSSHQTMEVVALPDGTYQLTMRDDFATVCRGASSTMTGIAEAGEPGTIVIAQPEYTCDDGSDPEEVDPRLAEQLRDLTFTYDVQRDALQDSLELAWTRASPTATESTPAPSPTVQPSPTETASGPAASFTGSWEATDGPPDSSHLTMEIVALPNGTYEVTILDDVASVCGGASSTMTGIAEFDEPSTIVIEQPEYTCDDGSRPRALSGPPLARQLRNLGFTYGSRGDALQDSLGLTWNRVEMEEP